MSATGEADGGGERGATLLEMMVVVGVLALTAGIVFPNLRRPYATLSSEAALASVASELTNARSTAIRQARAVTFQLGPDGRSYGWDARRWAIPASAAIRMAPNSLTFGPDGASAGGEVTLWRGDRRAGVVQVAADTGVVGLSGTRP